MGDKRPKVIVTLQSDCKLLDRLVSWLRSGASVAEFLALIGHVVHFTRMYGHQCYLITDIS